MFCRPVFFRSEIGVFQFSLEGVLDCGVSKETFRVMALNNNVFNRMVCIGTQCVWCVGQRRIKGDYQSEDPSNNVTLC